MKPFLSADLTYSRSRNLHVPFSQGNKIAKAALFVVAQCCDACVTGHAWLHSGIRVRQSVTSVRDGSCDPDCDMFLSTHTPHAQRLKCDAGRFMSEFTA